jgi:hypothetical protein
MNAAVAELRVLEAQAEQRRKTLTARVELARKEEERTAANVRRGNAPLVDQASATLRLRQLESDLAEADLDLARVQRQLDQHHVGR